MNVLRKTSGVILLLLTILLCFPAFHIFPIQFERCRKKFEDGIIGAPGYALGFVTILVAYILITYFLIKLSLKLIKKKKNNHTAIEEIGIQE